MTRAPSGAPFVERRRIASLAREGSRANRSVGEATGEGFGWLSAFFGSSPDLVALLDPEGTLLSLNWKIPDGTVIGRPFTNLISPETQAGAAQALAGTVESRRPTRFDAQILRADGTYVWHQFTVGSVMRGDQFVGMTVVATDIAERKQKEERLRRSEALMVDTQGVAHLGTWEWDITQAHAVWSPELYRIYGLDPRTHVPTYQDYLTRVHPDDRPRVEDATNHAFHDLLPYSHDERIFRADGSLRYLHTWAGPVLDESGKLIRLTGVCQDITDRKLAEIALVEHATELARAKAELEQLARVTAHDLQEPLRAVASFAQLLMERYKGKLDAAADETIDFIVQGVHRMKALISDLQVFSRTSGGRGVKKRIDLGAALAQVETDLGPAISEANAVIRHGPLPAVLADPAEVNSLLRHLVGNAIKFHGTKPPEIDIKAKLANGFVEVSVRDNGIGIAPAHQERIFVVFQRLNPDMPGTGIGLPVCKKIVEGYGGHLWVESAPGEGATFRFMLPATAATDK